MPTMKSKLILLALVVLVLSACQPNPLTKRATLVFYNVENLFDTEDDPLTNDEEFTPDGGRHWTYKKKNRKLLNLSKAILSSSDRSG